MQGLNVKEVCRQIKRASKETLLWWRQDGFHYITNRVWILRLPEERVPREILVQLFSVFAEIPEEKHVLTASGQFVAPVTPPKTSGVYGHMKKATPGEVTPFIREYGSFPALRVIRHKDYFIYVVDDYIQMIDYKYETPQCSGMHSPLFFLDGKFAVVPVRTEDSDDRNELQLLVKNITAATMVNTAAAIE